MRGLTPERIAEINAKNSRYHTRSSAKPEPNTGNAAQVPHAVESFNARVNVTFVVYRHRLLDPDNNYSKHITDAIVKSGILRNDTSNEIEEVRYKQVKIPEWEQEKTEIVIEALNE